MHVQMSERFPTLDSAIEHIRQTRALHPDEWHETPKPMLIEAARYAARWINRIETEKRAVSPRPAA